MRRPEVAFIVPSFQSASTLDRTLDSILDQRTTASCRILVVDSSPSNPMPELGRRYPEVEVIRSEERLFPGAARNLGAARTEARWIAFVDADAALQTDWLERLLGFLADKPGGAAGGWVANANPDGTPSRILHWLEFSEYLPGHPTARRDRLSTSNLLIRRTDFQMTGGFDEKLAMSEDSAFFSRFQGPIYFLSESGIDHLHRADWTSVRKHLARLGYWSGVVRAADRGGASWLRFFPLLSLLLPLWRLPGIVWRVGKGEATGLRGALPMIPCILRGLWAWASGFRRGLRRAGP